MNTTLMAFLALFCATPARAQQTHVTPEPAPAIGYDWNDDSSADDRVQQSLWPRADASAAGLDDMIHAEQTPVHVPIHEDGAFGTRALHDLRKVGGDYIVVPFLKLHFATRSRKRPKTSCRAPPLYAIGGPSAERQPSRITLARTPL
jgi:hypothetical protein